MMIKSGINLPLYFFKECCEMYKFETIYENYPHDEYGSYGYGMDRTFVLSDDGRE